MVQFTYAMKSPQWPLLVKDQPFLTAYESRELLMLSESSPDIFSSGSPTFSILEGSENVC